MKLYHGTIVPNIKELEPRKRYTPGQIDYDVPPAVYATDDPAYASAHAFPWGSNEGFDLYYDKQNILTFQVPKKYKSRLETEIFIYEVPEDKFTLLENVSPKGRNYWSLEKVVPITIMHYKSVEEAITKNNGIVKYF